MLEADETGNEGIPNGVTSALKLQGATSGIGRPDGPGSPRAGQQDDEHFRYSLQSGTYREQHPQQLQVGPEICLETEHPNHTAVRESLQDMQHGTTRISWNLRHYEDGRLRDILMELELNLHRFFSSKETDHQTSNTKAWSRCKALIKENSRLRTLLKDIGSHGHAKTSDKDLLRNAFYAWSTKAALKSDTDVRSAPDNSPDEPLRKVGSLIGTRTSRHSASGSFSVADPTYSRTSQAGSVNNHLRMRDAGYAAIRDVEESAASKKYELAPLWRDIVEGRYKHRTSQLANIGLRSSGSRLSETMPSRAPPMKRGSAVIEKLGTLQSFSNKFRVNPVGWRRMTWEAFGMAFIIYDLITVPLQAFDPPWNQLTIIMLCVTSAYWTIDIPSSFFIGFHIKGGLETRWWQMAKKYLMSWFIPDLLVVGIDWALLVLELHENSESENISYMKAGRGLRIMRFLRLLRLVKLSVYFDKILESSASEYVLTFMRVTKVILFILMCCHLIACLWYGIGNGLVNEDEGWAVETFHKRDSIGYRYTTSLHWSLTQFTPASMEVVPTNTIERCLNVCVVIVALVMFSTFISSITEAMTYLRKINSKKTEQYNQLRTYLAENQVTVELASRVWRYLEQSAQIRQKRLVYQDVTLLKDLPEVLRAELQEEMYSPVLKRHCFFAQYGEFNHLGVRTICQRATLEIGLAPGQYLFSLGENGKSMFFIAEGVLEYEQEEDLQKQIVSEGGWVSEACLWLQWIHHGTMISKVNTVLYVLDASNVHSVLLLYTDMLPRVVEYAALFFQACNKENPHYKVSDVGVDEDELLGIAQRAFEPEMPAAQVSTRSTKSFDFNSVGSLASATDAIKGWLGSLWDKVHAGSPKGKLRSGNFSSEGSVASTPAA